jgi:large subunit ribosomal protein L17
MFRNMANQTIIEERIVTTVQKAKEVRRVVDRLITLAKKPAVTTVGKKTGAAKEFHPSRRMAFDRTRDKAVVDKLFGELAKRYADRKGGYTRVVKLVDRRWGDSAEMAVLELVDHAPLLKGKAAKPDKPEASEKAAPAVAADPFARFRKLFAPKKGAAAKAEAAAPKKAAKAPRAKKSAKAAE